MLNQCRKHNTNNTTYGISSYALFHIVIGAVFAINYGGIAA